MADAPISPDKGRGNTESQYSRTGARRSGDDYQDVVALDLLVEALEHPERYQWLRVEADDFGSLDDVVALRSDGSYVVKQVKFATDPEDVFTWAYLLSQKSGKDGKKLPSLLQKWARTIVDISAHAQIHEACLISNRQPDADIRNLLLPSGQIDFDRIADAKVREILTEQTGSEAATKHFFLSFRFYLDRPSIERYEDGVRRRLSQLGVAIEGQLNLKDRLRSWVRIKSEPQPDGLIRIEDIRKAACWQQLRPMPQSFEVPTDYVLPDKRFYDEFVDSIQSGQTGCIVLTASPGVGKSTFLSYFYKDQKGKDLPVVRHHYFLSLSDRTSGRSDDARIAESLMSDILSQYPEALGTLANNNPSYVDLAKWVEACGGYFAERGRSLVIIIDGLDHVWREERSIESLNRLFEQLLSPPKGVVVVVGTQPVSDDHLPSRLVQIVPRDHWMQLPLLDIEAVRKWLDHHSAQIPLPEDDDSRERVMNLLASAFLAKGEGHPLWLKYAMSALQEGGIPVTEQNVRGLPGCPNHQITSYYDQLWAAIPEESRLILHLFGATGFPWKGDWITQCLDPESTSLAQVNRGLGQVRHLLSPTNLGLRPFHSSLLTFIEDREEHDHCREAVTGRALAWLATKAPAYWKWAYEWRLHHKLGNSQPLLTGLTREWCIEAIARRYSATEGHALLTLGTVTSIEADDLPRFVEIGLLRDYHGIAHDYRSDTLGALLSAQLTVEEDEFLRYRLYENITNLSESEIVCLSRDEARRGNTQIVSRCFADLNERVQRPRGDGHVYRPDEWEAQIAPLIRVAAHRGTDVPAKRFAEYVSRNREDGHSLKSVDLYARELWLMGDIAGLRALLKADLPSNELSVALRYVVLLSLEQEIDSTQEIRTFGTPSDSFAGIYASLLGIDDFTFEGQISVNTRLFRLPEYELYSNREIIADAFHDLFFSLFAHHLFHDRQPVNSLMEELGACPWVEGFIKTLAEIAARLAQIVISGQRVEYGWVYAQLKDLRRPRWPEDREWYKYGFAAEDALYRISFDILALTGQRTISKADLECVFRSGFCYRWTWLDKYVEGNRSSLAGDALSWVLASGEEQLKSTIEDFNTRALHFAALASLAAMHGERSIACRLIHECATNLITHGEHKDMIIFHALEAIKECHRIGVGESREWLKCLCPMIAAVRQFTDGDETHILPSELADAVAQIAPDALPGYYIWLSVHEEYDDALSVFHTFLRTADLSVVFNQAIAATAVDNESLAILSERANIGDIHARDVRDSIAEFLGGYTRPADKSSDQTTGTTLRPEREKGLPNPADFPPDKLPEYFKAAHAFYPYEKGQCLGPWLDFWNQTERREAAFQAVVEEDRRSERLGMENYDRLYEIALSLYGKDQAYPWLVAAHTARGGWSRYFTNESEAVRRWAITKEKYPDKWLDFIKRTMRSAYGDELSFQVSDRVVRLVKYCTYMGQNALAGRICAQLVESLCSLVSPIELPIPSWVNDL
jgi:hypothetical protein